MTENGRIVENHLLRQQFDIFIKRLKSLPELNLKNVKPATESVLQERYTFFCEYERISIVYEVNSGTLVITAADHILMLLRAELKSIVGAGQATANKPVANVVTKPANNTAKLSANNNASTTNNTTPAANNIIKPKVKPAEFTASANTANTANTAKPTNNTTPAANNIMKPKVKPAALTTNANTAKSVNNTETSAVSNIVKPMVKPVALTAPASVNTAKPTNNVQKPPQKKPALSQSVAAKNASNVKKQTEDKKRADDKKQAEEEKRLADKQQADEDAKRLEELYKNGYAIKKYSPEKLDEVLKKLKSMKGVTCRETSGVDGSRTYLIEDEKNKVYLRFVGTKKTLQLQGKRSKLFGEIQVLVSQDSDYVTAVSSHIDLTGEEKRARDMEKRLKKLLPNAFDFLSEQSRIDITIGMMDIGNDEVKLSDYSMLLVPPYRGLERLIFDLQRKNNIEVKMIGQAYEKLDTGGYVLKLGYRRKINSVVYAEVMSALYNEYFARRNFYAHSDITGDLLSRVITEKSAVKEIFDNLVVIIEYNIRKLKEIGFKP